jgi:phosphate acetyltransferase
VPAASVSAIYIASPEPETGKSTIALGLLHRLTATVAKVGVFRPITRLDGDRKRGEAGRSGSQHVSGGERDYILELLLAHTTAGLTYEQCVGVTYQQLHADPDGAIASIVDAYHAVAGRATSW